MATEKQPDLATRLRRAEKKVGSTRWALTGAGARKNPPDTERKKHLEALLKKQTAEMLALRKERDAAKPKAAKEKEETAGEPNARRASGGEAGQGRARGHPRAPHPSALKAPSSTDSGGPD